MGGCIYCQANAGCLRPLPQTNRGGRSAAQLRDGMALTATARGSRLLPPAARTACVEHAADAVRRRVPSVLQITAPIKLNFEKLT